MLQGSLSFNTGELANAENELKVAVSLLEGGQCWPGKEGVAREGPGKERVAREGPGSVGVVVEVRARMGLARLAWERGQWGQAEASLIR